MLIEARALSPVEFTEEQELNLNLWAIEAQDPNLDLKENQVILGEALARSQSLRQTPETLMGVNAVSETLRRSGLLSFFLPYRLLYSPAAFEAYLGMYSQFDPTLINSPVPAEDVYVVVDKKGKSLAYLQRSSLWSAVVDGVATARSNLTTEGDVMNVGGVQPCFRREVREEAKGWREVGFTQADIELAGLTDERITPQSLDTLSVTQMIRTLEAMGVSQEMIQIRVNNFTQVLYPIIGDGVSFLEKEQFGWNYLDKMATARVIGDWDEYGTLQGGALTMVRQWQERGKMNPTTAEFLIQLINSGQYDETTLKNAYPHAYCAFENLKTLVNEVMNQYPDVKIYVDALSIRGGTPGYDRTTIQADIVTPQKVFPEVAGGGAYQAAAKVSWRVLFNEEPPPNFYMVGFALGLLRIKTTLDFIRSSS